MQEQYDVVVVGGGAAGLSGAVALARSRRSVLVVDGGAPRNAPAGHVHNYLGREGTSPADLLATGRAEVAAYGGEVVTGEVVSAEALADHEPGTAFLVELADGGAVRARRLLVTTGLVDELPAVAGLAERWGRDVLHCPYCHGWEVRDQAVGVLASGPMWMHHVQLFRQLSGRVALFVHEAAAPDPAQRELLDALGVVVVEGRAAALEVVDDHLAGVCMADGRVVPVDALVVAPRFVARSGVLVSLGLEPAPLLLGGHEVGVAVAADATGLTAVPGVWVAGNVTNLMAQVIGSAAAGLQAGAVINADLAAEDGRAALAVLRSGELIPPFDEAFWEARYRGAQVWSGRPNAQLVAEVGGLVPGRALDVGCGEGGDVLWLAERGWSVVGVDIATAALERGAAEAAARGSDVADRTTWQHVDVLGWDPPAGAFDLVSAHFMHLAAADRVALHARLAAAVAPGGTLLLVGHHPWDHLTTSHRPLMPGFLFTPEELAAALDPAQWEVLVAETRPRQQTMSSGEVLRIQDAVVRARRRA